MASKSGQTPARTRVCSAPRPEDFKTKLFDIQVREIQFENEGEVHFSNQPSQRGRKLRWLQRLQGVPGVPGVQGEAAMSPKRTAPAKAKAVVEVATRARAAQIQVNQWWQQAQAETPFPLAQRHRNRHWCLLSVAGQEGQLVDAGQEATAESGAHRQCQRR